MVLSLQKIIFNPEFWNCWNILLPWEFVFEVVGIMVDNQHQIRYWHVSPER